MSPAAARRLTPKGCDGGGGGSHSGRGRVGPRHGRCASLRQATRQGAEGCPGRAVVSRDRSRELELNRGPVFTQAQYFRIVARSTTGTAPPRLRPSALAFPCPPPLHRRRTGAARARLTPGNIYVCVKRRWQRFRQGGPNWKRIGNESRNPERRTRSGHLRVVLECRFTHTYIGASSSPPARSRTLT